MLNLTSKNELRVAEFENKELEFAEIEEKELRFAEFTTVSLIRAFENKTLADFQNFRQSCVLLTDRIEIQQLQPLVRPSNLLYVMLSG